MNNFYINGRNIEYDKKYIAPARINLIGEHIDYNGGCVFPACVNLYISAYVKKRDDNKIILESQGYKTTIETTLDKLDYNDNLFWGVYPIGVLYIIKKLGYKIKTGLEIYYESKIPSGSGLSSSAAILVVTTFLISDIFNLNISLLDIIKITKMVENDYCKLKSGIMDQSIIALGKRNKGLLLNCDNLDYQYKNIKINGYSIVVLKTNKPRKLTESKYNERVDECNKALSILKLIYKINNLCDLKSKDLDNVKNILNDEVLYRRVKHVITENERVYEFAKSLEEGNISEIARLLNESHESLRKDYEVTGIHLDSIVDSAISSGAIGARMTGAGFGGCAIALVKNDILDDFKKNLIKKYKEKTNITPDVIPVIFVDGVKIEE
ncbi:MAG: galactokinase [Acholeplasmatales bacterium]|nr:galactokinase [Acholeplasmatales bacterium]